MTPTETVVSKLESGGFKPRDRSGKWTARCPAHDDRNASLSIGTGDDGRALVKCFAGCSVDDITRALDLGAADLFPAREKPTRRPAKMGGAESKPTTVPLTVESLASGKRLPVDFLRSLGLSDRPGVGVIIPYRKQDGSLFRNRIRSELRANDGSKWDTGEGTCVYGLDRLADAQSAGFVIIVEGESDCWTLWHHGFPALGIPGASLVHATFPVDLLNGVTRLFVFHEPDKGGDTFISGVKAVLTESNWTGDARVLRLPGFKDPSDAHIHDPEAFPALLREAMESAEPLAIHATASVEKPSLFPLTDTGNAERFARDHGEQVRHCKDLGGFLVYDGKRWARDHVSQVESLAKETVRRIYAESSEQSNKDARERLAKWAIQSESAQRREAMLKLVPAEPGISVRADLFDRDPWALNCQNGTLDLRTGALRPHNPEDLITRIAPVPYDPHADCPTWEGFLSAVVPDPEVRAFLQRAVGYSLTGDVREQVLFFLHGDGANGKSTLLNAVMSTIGSGVEGYSIQAAPGLLISRKNEQHPTELFDLKGSRLVCSSEIDDGARMNEARVKTLTGGDPIKARPMHRDFFQFSPTAKLWLCANHRPAVRGTDHAIWRRILLIPFQVRIDKPDKSLTEKLRAEKPGILAWAVAGCIAWQRDGFNPPDAVTKATADYRNGSDVVAPFIEERCVVQWAASAESVALWSAWDAWCERLGFSPQSRQWFYDRLRERGFQDRIGSGNRKVFDGIGLRASGSYESEAG